jgi:DNA polymerase-4/DNA polymerase IV (DinB-like DNA polymerase)
MQRQIIHVDMDAFYASVEIRDNPELFGKPLIVGALPTERGVVSTCSYEARKYGVRSAMSIKEAYRLCPDGIYMHPNFHKYYEASNIIHEIWNEYTDLVSYISLDEGFLDVTGSAHLFGGARSIGHEIRKKTKQRTSLTCSVGIGYSLSSAKIASEEKKPDGFFEIPNAEALKNLIIDRNVRIIYTVGAKTAQELNRAGIKTVRDIYQNKQKVIDFLGNHGREIINLAEGIDERRVVSFAEAKSMGKETTFQNDITDISYLKDVLLLLATELSYECKLQKLYCATVTLKVTYYNMQKITRSKTTGDITNSANTIYSLVSDMLDKIEKHPIRLVGISLSNLTKTPVHQLNLEEMATFEQKEKADEAILKIQQKYGRGIIKTGSELNAQKRIYTD